MKWSNQAWDASKQVFQQIIDHPFLQELANGTLPQEKFTFYLYQDSCYLSEYGRVLAAIAAKLDNPDHRNAFLRFANDTILVETALHKTFLTDAPNPMYKGQSPTCMLYTGYLFQQVASSPLETALSSVLPCFRIYKEVGDHILKHHLGEGNPYQSWISTYGGEEFSNAVQLATSICDELAERCSPEQQQSMTEAFLYASKMEWMFWDSAYRLEKWPV
jgi:thiaminase (transcriptional activator TenA)